MVEVDLTIYPRDAVLRACYSLDDIASFQLVGDPGKATVVEVVPRGSSLADDEIVSRLKSALIDFALRVQIEEQTRELRDQIWRTAFAELGSPSR
ncbi:His-Xaa-Ser system protein HxsD [Faunimonas pinastri]|uniref:His-Xaa-Ser system protein HxsD n=1 Tax=Faunimonas pinastri TaxID=1855383 RepID=A0A1H9QFN4_9HYPH|nr:His-Xaa-Ser system protein HxsD [Faunimonas pinastri]SER59284.1 His-Xaa-Ser system protein HxsD [Faunimonas pinastri]